MHLLMIVVPSLAIPRGTDSGLSLSTYAMHLIAPSGIKNPALTALLDNFCGLLGWVLLALIVGHIAVALVHGVVWRDGTLGAHDLRGPIPGEAP